MIRKVLRVLLAIVLFVVTAFFSAVLTVKAMESYVWRTSHSERRLWFDRDLRRGERIGPDDVGTVWAPVDTPATIPLGRLECLADRHVLADVSRGDLVQPMLVEGAVECLRRERPDEGSRD